jgi:Leucine-rich repeat (LRR) protein
LAELKLGLGKVSIDLIFPLTALSRLTKLNLAHNSWGTIAGQLDQVLPRSLCELDLSNGKWNCPPIMTQLTNLTNLRLAESTWTMQPDKQSQHIVLPTSLKVLDCFESTLLESWETLANLTCLTRLNISQGWSRMLEEQGYDKFPTSLQALYLGMMPQSFSPSQLTYLTRLTKLSFKNEAKLW